MLRHHVLSIFALASCAAAIAAACGVPPSPHTTRSSSTEPSASPPSTARPDAGTPFSGHVGPQPRFGATFVQPDPPPPISGGTLLVTSGGSAVAADPDRDAVYVVDLATSGVTTLALQAGDEPGRGVEDASGRVHVALRKGGAVVDIDVATKAIVGRRPVCVAPRGIAYDAADDTLWVACMSGELVQLPADGGAAVRTLVLGRDLRDVVVEVDHVVVSRFRSADVLQVSKASGEIDGTTSPGASDEGATPSVAWRMLATPDGAALMLHQRGNNEVPVPVSRDGYGGGGDGCDRSIVEGAVTRFGPEGVSSSPALSDAVVPVDMAVSPRDGSIVVVATGNAHTPTLPQLLTFDAREAAVAPKDAGAPSPPPSGCIFSRTVEQPHGQAIAAAYSHDGMLVVQTREPAALFLPQLRLTIPLAETSRDDTGHDVFHSNAGANIACASCHAEGGDDGRVWTFDGLGPRRTPSLRGTIAGTAPYHWRGEMQDFPQLLHEVFSGRMGGPTLAQEQLDAVQHWVGAIPAPPAPPPADAAAAARGDALFHGAAGCSGCHTGPALTNDATVDVGTGGAFQVPPLVGVSYRAPFLHAGCAATLADRFTCGGARHGSQALSPAQIGDLVAYLETL